MVTEITLPYNYKPRLYQEAAWMHFQGADEGKRGICVWHRRAGKDLFGINMIATKLFERPGIYWHILPTYKQGRSIVWNGMTREGRPFLDHFPPEIIQRKLDNEMRIHFIERDRKSSIYQVVGTDDVDLLVGTNPVGCIFSEYSLQNPAAWRYIAPILRENGGWALFIFTPRGKNHAYTLLKMAQDNPDWFVDVRVAGNNGTKKEDGTPVITDDMINADLRSGMPQEIAQQEYFVSFEAPLVGAYYGKEMTKAQEDKRITDVPHEPKLTVDTYWDIGYDDSTSIVFVQSLRGEHRIIDYYENSGENLPFYFQVLQKKAMDNGYIYGKHHAPWDMEIHEFTSGRTRLETARSLGVNFKVAKQQDVLDGIANVRGVLGRCWFDKHKADRLIEALKSYRKEKDEAKDVFKSKPFHDWSSHGADAMRVFAWFNSRKIKYGAERKPQKMTVDNYEYI